MYHAHEIHQLEGGMNDDVMHVHDSELKIEIPV